MKKIAKFLIFLIKFNKGENKMGTEILQRVKKLIAIVLVLLVFSSLVTSFESLKAGEVSHDSFVLVIDCSGSMHEWKEPKKGGGYTIHPGTDPEDLRVTAARVFIELLPLEDKVGAITFYTDTKEVNGCPDINYSLNENSSGVHFDTIFGLQEINSETNRRTMISKLEQAKKSQGFTFIRKALEIASNMLNADKNAKNKYIVLLTDGSPSQSWLTPSGYETKEWIEELRNNVIKTSQEIANEGISIYTVLLSDIGSERFLREIAYRSSKSTGKGMFFYVKKPEDLSDVFSRIFSDTKNYFFKDISEDNVIITSEFTKQTYFLLLRKDKSETFSIITPKGIVIKPNQSDIGDVNYRWSEDLDKNYKLFVLNSPEVGAWKIRKENSDRLMFSIIEGLYINLQLDRPKNEELFYFNEDIPIEGRVVLSKQGLNLDNLEYQIALSIMDSFGEKILKSLQLPGDDWEIMSSNGIFQQKLSSSSYSEIPFESELKVSIQILLRLKKDKRLVYKSVPIFVRVLPGNSIKIDSDGIRLNFKWKDKLPRELQGVIKFENPGGKFNNLNFTLQLDTEGKKSFVLDEQNILLRGNSFNVILTPTSPLKKSFLRSRILKGGILITPTERGYSVEPSFLPIYVKVHSFLEDFYGYFLIAIGALIMGFFSLFAKWISLPWPVGTLVLSTTEGASSQKIRLRERSFLSKLLHKSKFYIGSGKNNDKVVQGLAKLHFCISAQRVRSPKTGRSELVLRIEPLEGTVKTFTSRNTLSDGDKFVVQLNDGRELIFEYRGR